MLAKSWGPNLSIHDDGAVVDCCTTISSMQSSSTNVSISSSSSSSLEAGRRMRRTTRRTMRRTPTVAVLVTPRHFCSTALMHSSTTSSSSSSSAWLRACTSVNRMIASCFLPRAWADLRSPPLGNRSTGTVATIFLRGKRLSEASNDMKSWIFFYDIPCITPSFVINDGLPIDLRIVLELLHDIP